MISVSLASVELKAMRYCCPLVALFGARVVDAIEIINAVTFFFGIHLVVPMMTVDGAHSVLRYRIFIMVFAMMYDIQYQFFSENGIVVYVEI